MRAKPEAAAASDQDPEPDAATGAFGTKSKKRPPFKIAAAYDYFDAEGVLRFQVVRLDPKGFPQRRPGPSGGWIWNTKGVTLFPYHLPEVLKAVKEGRRVYIAGGEKGADRVCSLGLTATCSPGGEVKPKPGKPSKKFKPEYAQYFAGGDVVILPDNDETGLAHAKGMAVELRRVGAKVRIVQLPDLGLKEDVWDWIERGGTAKQLTKLADDTEEDTEGPHDWMRDYDIGKNGPYTNLDNALVALRGAPALRGCFAYDEMICEPVVVRALPGEKDEGFPRREADRDAVTVTTWIQRHGSLPRISLETVRTAITQCAYERRYHPVRDWLNGLKWDGKKRAGGWLQAYLRAEGPPEYLAAIGRMFLIAMVRRVFEPGCQSDYVMVLESTQGDQKSTLCRVLAGEWAGDHLPPIHHKDASQYLIGKWLTELAELDSIRKPDVETLKAFITRRTEDYRPAYGRKNVLQPRQNVFLGTTNNATYLKDATGARRFWPVKVSNIIDTEGLTRDRDQLFAEAMVMYQAGEASWPDREFEKRWIVPEQEGRFEEDAWQGEVIEKLQTWGESVAPGYIPRLLTLMNIAQNATDLDKGHIGTAVMNRIRAIMIRLGWEPYRSNGVTTWRPGPKATVRPPEAATATVVPIGRKKKRF
ncbi:virulence-associated E family protein [Acidisoma sp. S159]|uniref:virulence-associated E family protein n=1 Tax=Acidisoma sp. S159 TaxID=1747225 RepID=UPI00131DAC73|nr:virulence-associated E family protein [Acidisoma sp. S159]